MAALANKLKQLLLATPFLRNLNEMRYARMVLGYRPEDLTPDYYERVKSFRELEHQIGRLQNFRAIIGEIRDKELPGDFVEFGTWRGYSLLWTAYFCERAALFDRALIGIDGFVGLPNDDGIFWRGQFSDVSRKTCEHNLKASTKLGQIKDCITIHQALFEEQQKMLPLMRDKKFVFVHIDCDIGSAAAALFRRFHESDCLADECYLLFDDYGCESSLREVVDRELRALSPHWLVSQHSATKLTKNFRLRKRRDA
jgi:hypothetical protein